MVSRGDRASRHGGREFESLVAGANAGTVRRRAAEPPRLIRARHYARYQIGRAFGPVRARDRGRPIGTG